MAMSRWLEQLTTAFHRQGLPRAYVERIISELSEHAEDILREENGMDAEQQLISRIGTPESIATSARREYLSRSFTRCHPILTFIVGPPVVLASLLLITSLIGILLYNFIDTATSGSLTQNELRGLPPSATEFMIVLALNEVLRFIPFAISVYCFARLGLKSDQVAWGTFGCGVVVLFALFFNAIAHVSTDNQMGVWSVGLTSHPSCDQFMQATISGLFAAWLLTRSSSIEQGTSNFATQ